MKLYKLIGVAIIAAMVLGSCVDEGEDSKEAIFDEEAGAKGGTVEVKNNQSTYFIIYIYKGLTKLVDDSISAGATGKWTLEEDGTYTVSSTTLTSKSIKVLGGNTVKLTVDADGIVETEGKKGGTIEITNTMSSYTVVTVYAGLDIKNPIDKAINAGAKETWSFEEDGTYTITATPPMPPLTKIVDLLGGNTVKLTIKYKPYPTANILKNY